MLYEITDESLLAVPTRSFALREIRERDDLQRLLRDHVEVIDADLLLVAEEFGDWQDARRRIDLLAIDRQANLVVIELKRTDDGGHMELQALRYVSMLSTMTADQCLARRRSYQERTQGIIRYGIADCR